MKQTAVVIPTYNERENIIALLGAVHDALPAARILVVDDSSPDGTAEIVKAFAAECSWVRLLLRAGKEGLGPAYFAGFRSCLEEGFDPVIQMDADFSHQPRFLPDLVNAQTNGADLVIGSRYVAGGGTENWGLVRRLVSRGGSLYASLALGLGIGDVTGGFRCWSAPLLHRVTSVPLNLTQFGFQIEMAYRARLLGAVIREVPIVFPDRERGMSKMSRRIFVEAFTGVLRLRLRKRALLAALRGG